MLSKMIHKVSIFVGSWVNLHHDDKLPSYVQLSVVPNDHDGSKVHPDCNVLITKEQDGISEEEN